MSNGSASIDWQVKRAVLQLHLSVDEDRDIPIEYAQEELIKRHAKRTKKILSRPFKLPFKRDQQQRTADAFLVPSHHLGTNAYRKTNSHDDPSKVIDSHDDYKREKTFTELFKESVESTNPFASSHRFWMTPSTSKYSPNKYDTLPPFATKLAALHSHSKLMSPYRPPKRKQTEKTITPLSVSQLELPPTPPMSSPMEEIQIASSSSGCID